jgi:hypothetical protein
MPLARTKITCNLDIADGDAYLDYVQVPDGSMNITAQFSYSGLDDNVTVSLQQSLDGSNYDNVVDMVLDKDDTSATLNVMNLLTTWVRFYLQVGEAKTGIIKDCYFSFN